MVQHQLLTTLIVCAHRVCSCEYGCKPGIEVFVNTHLMLISKQHTLFFVLRFLFQIADSVSQTHTGVFLVSY